MCCSCQIGCRQICFDNICGCLIQACAMASCSERVAKDVVEPVRKLPKCMYCNIRDAEPGFGACVVCRHTHPMKWKCVECKVDQMISFNLSETDTWCCKNDECSFEFTRWEPVSAETTPGSDYRGRLSPRTHRGRTIQTLPGSLCSMPISSTNTSTSCGCT